MSIRQHIGINKCLIIITVFLFTCKVYAQPTSIDRKKNPYSWMFGLGWNVVDDDGKAFTNLFDYNGSWNYLPYPTRISIDKYLRRGWSLEGMGAYNYYNSNKLINDTTGISGIFISGDFHVKYSFYRFLAPAKWFDPYISSGLGVTYREAMGSLITPTVNLSFGANFWFAKRWGVQIQTTGKLAIVADIYDSNADYIQHSIGIVYRRQPTKKSNRFDKKRHGWVHDKRRFKRKNT